MSRPRVRVSIKQIYAAVALLITAVAGIFGVGGTSLDELVGSLTNDLNTTISQIQAPSSPTLADIPAYDGSPYVYINTEGGNSEGTPSFTDSEIERAKSGAFESYSPLDSLGRCGTALACLGPETLPTDERGSIQSVHPTGWRQNFYEFVEQEALYNRCHLIAWSLSGENANAQNLITGTRSMNTDGMLPFEMKVLDYIRETGNHVLYRATPIFSGMNMLADGVHLEAFSIEDDGNLQFNIYAYNVEPGVEIDYATGNNQEASQ